MKNSMVVLTNSSSVVKFYLTEQQKRSVSRFPSATIYNTYGPTEATVAVTSIQITQEILDQYPTLPVGVERPGARLSTTDEGELLSKVKV